jgi:hypothetical protein
MLRRPIISGICLALRLSGLVGRFGLTLFIAKYHELDDLALYGVLVGVCAVMVAVTGMGYDQKQARFVLKSGLPDVVRRVRDRSIVRLMISLPALGIIWLLMRFLLPQDFTMTWSIAFILMGEPIVYELQQTMIYRGKPIAGNLLLAARSGFWIPIVLGAGLFDPSWLRMDAIYFAWALSVLASFFGVMIGIIVNVESLRALRRSLDRDWIADCVSGTKLAFASDLGFVAIVYSDRFVISALLGPEDVGKYLLIWAFSNSIVPLAQASVFNTSSVLLSELAHNGDFLHWRQEIWRGFLRTLIFSIVMATLIIPFSLATTLYLEHDPWQYAWLLITMVVATVLRLLSDFLHLVLCSAACDVDWPRINIVGLFLSPIAIIVCVEAFGLMGAGIQMMVMAIVLIVLRAKAVSKIYHF